MNMHFGDTENEYVTGLRKGLSFQVMKQDSLIVHLYSCQLAGAAQCVRQPFL